MQLRNCLVIKKSVVFIPCFHSFVLYLYGWIFFIMKSGARYDSKDKEQSR
jgi:hypothetical protein